MLAKKFARNMSEGILIGLESVEESNLCRKFGRVNARDKNPLVSRSGSHACLMVVPGIAAVLPILLLDVWDVPRILGDGLGRIVKAAVLTVSVLLFLISFLSEHRHLREGFWP